MKSIIALHRDGTRLLLFVTGADFNTQEWANNRKQAFHLLRIVRILEEYA